MLRKGKRKGKKLKKTGHLVDGFQKKTCKEQGKPYGEGVNSRGVGRVKHCAAREEKGRLGRRRIQCPNKTTRGDRELLLEISEGKQEKKTGTGSNCQKKETIVGGLIEVKSGGFKLETETVREKKLDLWEKSPYYHAEQEREGEVEVHSRKGCQKTQPTQKYTLK